ncbi:tetratricopeptide repeat protein [Micromonospora sp. WMMD1128]|uniref:tetratricopeptide repeat protein n=1 Tax=Micromonospora sp. WMMD1128 TaxID=3015150 RepID=UPI00248D16B5|nr:tetratricopeptide repeat protein [Micromonospora sp. WMMD1128]WBB75839.1 tetratricopeptide repeat protein [Micromonospora sp. WMMD1128]
MTATRADDPSAVMPDPGRARTLDELTAALRSLKVWAGNPSYERITSQVNTAWRAAGRPAGELTKRPTVVDCFKPGRRRLNADLVTAVVQALHPDEGYVHQWRQALRVVGGEARAAAVVRVQDRLPPDLAGFTGRASELDQLRHALTHDRHAGGAAAVAAIEGMAGVGKTRLAVHAGHLLIRESRFDRTLFVNLRGFFPDPARPPADPAAVLDGFLRLLGVPAHQIPHDLHARRAAYRDRLTGTRTLIVLDNAADVDQVRPLLPEVPGCLTLITSRRILSDLRPTARLVVDVFAAHEAVDYLVQVVSHVPMGDDPVAAARIAQRCGYLPLALDLTTGHMRATPGWTLTDHADRLDERHRQRRLETGVELALDLSYHHLPAGQRRLLRLLALHPGQDSDAYAAAALTGTDLDTTRAHLDHLCRDHLLQQSASGRYTLHDLVRAFAITRAHDEVRPADRREALTRLFDHYLATAAAAMNALHPAQAHLRPHIPPTGTPAPELADPDCALAWLDVERPTLVTVAVHTASNGWPTHTTRLSRILYRYLAGGRGSDAVIVHSHAHHAARQTGDVTEQAHALTDLGVAHLWVARYEAAVEHFTAALHLFREAGHEFGQARTQTNLGVAEQRLGHYRKAAAHFRRGRTAHLLAGNQIGQALALSNLGDVEQRLGHYRGAARHLREALALYRQSGDQAGEAVSLANLAEVDTRSGRYETAAANLAQALVLFRQAGHRNGEAWTLDGLGTLHRHLGQPVEAARHHRQALTILQTTGDRHGAAWALNGLGEAMLAAGHATDALTHHTAAHAIAAEIGARDQQARAEAGLAGAHRALADHDRARAHYRHALTIYTDLGTPEADQIRTCLAALDDADART